MDYQPAEIVQRQTTEVFGDFGRLDTDLETTVKRHASRRGRQMSLTFWDG